MRGCFAVPPCYVSKALCLASFEIITLPNQDNFFFSVNLWTFSCPWSALPPNRNNWAYLPLGGISQEWLSVCKFFCFSYSAKQPFFKIILKISSNVINNSLWRITRIFIKSNFRLFSWIKLKFTISSSKG